MCSSCILETTLGWRTGDAGTHGEVATVGSRQGKAGQGVRTAGLERTDSGVRAGMQNRRGIGCRVERPFFLSVLLGVTKIRLPSLEEM